MVHARFRPPGLRPTRAPLKISCFGLSLIALFSLSGAAISQQPAIIQEPIINIVSSTIEYVPPLARAVLMRDPVQVSKLLETGEKIDDLVRAKDGARAGFTPLILAAALSDDKMAHMLIQRGANITLVDNFHRSAFWYAALRENVDVTRVLITAPNAVKVVDAADDDLKRTPLHIAVHGNAPEIVRLLLKLGALREKNDYLGDTPDSFCKRRLTKACEGLSLN